MALARFLYPNFRGIRLNAPVGDARVKINCCAAVATEIRNRKTPRLLIISAQMIIIIISVVGQRERDAQPNVGQTCLARRLQRKIAK